MKQAYRCIVLLSLAVLSACGGGGGGSSDSSSDNSHDFAAGGSNVVTFTVGPGPGNSQTFNIPLTTVTVCMPATTTCATIPDVLIDTGSSGLRLMASVLTARNLTLTPMTDPRTSGNMIDECLPFADGYTWGEVASAAVSIGSEHADVPVQVIDDRQQPSPAAPSSCSSYGTALNSINAFDANGILGVGVFNQDCGTGCAQTAYDVYYTCTPGSSCVPTTQPVADQVANPVANFPTDNNGVILQLPSIASTGATGSSGYLVFGIGTESNNGLGTATVLTASNEGDFTTLYGSQTLNESFIDSGSNGLFFPNDPNQPIATCSGAPHFYCPSSTLSTSATNQGENGTSVSTPFQVADLNAINTSSFAVDDAAGPADASGLTGSYFDWGLPFFYGRTVFTAIEGRTAGGAVGPYYAY